jgi:hypothetical protein
MLAGLGHAPPANLFHQGRLDARAVEQRGLDAA